VPPELVDAELERLRSGMATSEELEEQRPARAGDLLTINAKRWEEGEWTTSRMPPEQEVVLEKGTVPDELLAALEGAAVDEEKVVEFEQPAPDGERNRLLVRVAGIRSRQVPELDDEFAKDVGDFDNLEALREDVERRLREMLENNEDERVRHSLFTALREKNPLELPATLVERQTEAMKAQFEGMLGAAASDKEDDGEREGARERLEEGASSAAKGVIHHHLLLKEIARLWEVEVADDEVDEELQVVARQSGLPLPMVRAEYAKGPRLDELKSKILERKVFDLARSKVKIVEIDPPTGEEDADQG
jgi:trigger factor